MSQVKKYPELEWADLGPANAALSTFGSGTVQCIMITADSGEVNHKTLESLKKQFGFREIMLPDSKEALALISVKYTDPTTKKLSPSKVPYKEIAEHFQGAIIKKMPINELFNLWEGLELAQKNIIVSTASSIKTERALLSKEFVGINEDGKEIFITADELRFYQEGDHLIFPRGSNSNNSFLHYNWQISGAYEQAARDLLKEAEITGNLIDIHRIDKAIEFGYEKVRLSSDRAATIQADLCHHVKTTYLVDVQRSHNRQEITLDKLTEINDIVANLPTPTRSVEKPVLSPALGLITRKYLEAVDKCRSLTIINAETLGANVFTPTELPLRLIEPTRPDRNPLYQGIKNEFGDIPYTHKAVRDLNQLHAENILFSSHNSELISPEKIGNLTVTRNDHSEILHALYKMPNDSSGVFIISADDGFNLGAVDMSSFEVHNHIYKNYNVLDAADIAPIISGNNNPENAKRVYIINGRRPVPSTTNAPTDINALYSLNDLFTFANGIQSKFSDQLSFTVTDSKELLTTTSISDILATYTSNQRDAAKYDLNFLQSRYTPLTSIVPANDMSAMPTNFVHAAREAIIKLVRDVGNPDQFLMNEMGMTSEQIANVFDAEQIDAITMGIWRLKNGKPFLQGDATGKGKGRTLAAMMAWSIRNGHPPVFMTSKADLLSDIYRDIRDIGMGDVVKPLFIAPHDMEIIDKNENKTLISKDEIREAAKNQLANKDYSLGDFNCILTTYTQVNQLKKTVRKRNIPLERLMGDRAKWLLNFTERHNPQFIIDESHNIATNDTNRGKVLDYVTGKSNRPIIRASATWAKNAKNIARCYDMFPDEYNEETLRKMVQRGGTALQEVLSTTLIAEGAMVRREHNFGKRQVNIVQSHETQRNRKATDGMASIMQKAAHYTKRQFEIYKSAYIESYAAQDAVERTSNIEQFSFSSSFSLIADGFTNAMRASAAAQSAYDAIMKNQKPIIGIDKTAESSLDFLYQAVKQEGSDKVVLEEFPDFKTMMLRWIEKQGTREYKVIVEPTLAEMREAQINGTIAEPTVEKHQITWREEMPKGTVEYEELLSLEKDLIKSLDLLPELPLSPIDYVKTELAKKDISTAEVSGRKLHVRLHEDGRRYVIEPREKETKAEAQFAFNSNEKDAIILTKAGTEGISLHAAESLAKYGTEALNQRHVILMGSFMNIVDEEQFFGRGERKGQVAKAESSKVITGMPIEARMLALSERNRLRLSASTTGNSKSLRATNTMPNLLNTFGDNVVAEYLSLNESVIDLLGFDEIAKSAYLNYGSDAVKATEISSTAGSVLGRMMLLDYNQQNALLDNITSFYNAKLTALQARGLDPINTKNIQGSVDILEEAKLSGNVLEHYDSEFDKPVLVQRIKITSPPVAIDTQVIENDIRIAQSKLDSFLGKKNATFGDLALHILSSKNEALQHAVAIHNSKAKYLKNSIHYVSVSDALNDERANDIKTLDKNCSLMVKLFSSLKLGGVYNDLYNKEHSMVITGLEVPINKNELLESWMYRIKFSRTSGDLDRKVSPDTFAGLIEGDIKNTLNATDLGQFSAQHPICEEFEMLKLNGPVESAIILTGNMVEASRINSKALIGSHVTIIDKKSNTSISAIRAKHDLSFHDVISKRFSASNSEIDAVKDAFGMNLLENQIFLFEHRTAKSSDNNKTAGHFFFGKDGKFTIHLPKTKAGAMELGVPDPFDGRESYRSKANARSGCSVEFKFDQVGDFDFVLDKVLNAGFSLSLSAYELGQLEGAIAKHNSINSNSQLDNDAIEDAIIASNSSTSDENYENLMPKSSDIEDQIHIEEALSVDGHDTPNIADFSSDETESDEAILDEIMSAVKADIPSIEDSSAPQHVTTGSLMDELESGNDNEDTEQIVNFFASPM